MSLQQLLQQVLQSGQDLTRSAASGIEKKASGSPLGGFTGGAVAGGALGLLLGNKKFRKMGGKVARYGGAAALGALALKTWQDWQAGKAAQVPAAVTAPAPGATAGGVQATGSWGAASVPATAIGQPVSVEPGWAPAQIEEHSRVILAAMVAAAKADGHIGPEERQLLEGELVRLSASAADRAWLEAEVQKPADPAHIARLARSPEMAAEIYLASVLVIDDESFMERAYLDELARTLALEPGLKQHLEERVRALAA